MHNDAASQFNRVGLLAKECVTSKRCKTKTVKKTQELVMTQRISSTNAIGAANSDILGNFSTQFCSETLVRFHCSLITVC
jgi:hypothetical protein